MGINFINNTKVQKCTQKHQNTKGEKENIEQVVKLLIESEEKENVTFYNDKIKQGNNYNPLNKTHDKMGGTSVFNKLKVVIWKNVIIRKRHWLLSILEIAIPVILFVLISYARSKVEGIGKRYINETTYNEVYPSTTFYNDRSKGDSFIYYTPENQFTSALIYEVQLKLNLNSAAVKGFTDEDELVAYYEKFATNETVMGVVFKGLSNNEIPKKLDYSIRPYDMYEEWDTDKLFDSYMSYVPERGSAAYVYKGFIAMQMAIDTSFIQMVSNKQKLPFALTMQEFPYPPYLDDMGIVDMFSIILPLTTVFSFVFLCPAVIKRIVEEKRTGIKELMKMMGLKSWMLWVGWFIHAFTVNFLSVLIITLFMKVPFWGAEYAPIQHCDASVFAIFLILYTSAGITFCFAISSLFSSPAIAVVFGILAWQLSYSIPNGIVDKAPNMNWGSKMGFSLFPNMGLYFGFQAISVYESREVGASWSNLFKSASGGRADVTMGNVFIMFIVDIILYTLIALYFERVRPGPYGLSKPFLFPIKFVLNKFKRKNNTAPVQHEHQPQENDVKDYCKIESASNLHPGIEVSHLYKKYGSHVAVDDFSIDIYQDQITVLLGHNGAGKTTTMSIITGMIGASAGKIIINGVNIKQNMDQVHGYLGICPQHNLQFTDLTVLEHLMFFGMLKGLSKQKAREEALRLLERLNLSSKKNSLASKLSGGMRRKLSLGITLMGDSSVLILDEPTSGLDPEARREIWDILLEFRGSRTIVITTHFMEEADVLGDRIAIMDHGRLICYGSPMYLKKEYGTGYHLTLIYEPKEDILNQKDTITKTIQSIIQNAKLESEHSKQLTYLLPHEDKSSFGRLLSNLENNKETLAISNINVSVTTLEEVFLKVGSNMAQIDKSDRKSISSGTSNSYEKVKGWKLLSQQLRSLVNKRRLVTSRKGILFSIQFLIAMILTSLTLYLGHIDESSSENFLEFNMNLNKYEETGVFYGVQGSNPSVNSMGQIYKDFVQQQKGLVHLVDSVSDAIIEKGEENIAYYKQHMIVAAEFNSTSDDLVVNAMYASKALHGAPISLNLVMNAVIKSLMGEAYEISTSNKPLPIVQGNYFKDTSELQATMLWFILFPLGLLFFSGTFIFFPQMEKVTSVKQMQIMCGLKVFWYWITNYIFDLILYTVLVWSIIILVLSFGYPVYNGNQEIIALFLIMFLYGVCVIPYSYLFSYMKTAAGAFASYLISGLFVSVILMIIVLIMEFSGDKYYENISNILNYIFLIFPQYALTCATVRFARRAIGNHNWNSDSEANRRSKCRFDPNPCCGDLNSDQCKTYQSQFYGKDNISLILVEMFCSTFFYFFILLILETRFVKRQWNVIKDKWNQILHFKLRKTKPQGEHTVDGEMDDDNNSNDEAGLLNVTKLQKKYGDQEVVKEISFGVNSGDCFGLLGVNGAGKTTTFRMLTGFEHSYTGTVNIHEEPQDWEISKNLDEYLQRVGYCPQFDAINEMLSGREMLQHFAKLRGINDADSAREVDKWLDLLDLTEYQNKRCGEYSGGNKRKLSVAMALIGDPSIIMLDEPTSGVDPVSRRKLWNVVTLLKEQIQKKTSIILTSHSMEECEILCNKLTIMKKGKLECLGTIPELKKKYSQGFTVKLKLNILPLEIVVDSTNEDSMSVASQSQPLHVLDNPIPADLSQNTDANSKAINKLMKDFKVKFDGELIDQHSGLLHYHLKNKNLKWSTLFQDMEALVKDHKIIDDYHISETTLEEVFLSIAKGH